MAMNDIMKDYLRINMRVEQDDATKKVVTKMESTSSACAKAKALSLARADVQEIHNEE